MITKFSNTIIAPAVVISLMAGMLYTTSQVQAESAPAESSGLLPIPDYSGGFAERSFLLGDLGGKRTDWAKKGITFDVIYNQYFQTVVDGGVNTDSEYGGTVDYNINIDFDRMGLIPGGLLQMRAVSRYGDSVNGISGSIIPVNTDATHPTTSTLDENVTLWLPVINYTQFLNEKVAVGFGKYDTYSTANEFAGGRGVSQWWNLNLAMPVSPALIVPYSTLAATALFMPNPNLTVTGMVGTSTDTSNSSGFNYLDDGMFGLLQATNKYQVNELPGGVGVMVGYGWDGNFNEINGRIDVGGGQLNPSTKDDTWFGSIDFWQYLWVEGDQKREVDINNGRQDLQGIGIFSRLQTADQDTNVLDYNISFGVNGKGLIPGRDNDAMGIAYNYNRTNTGRFLNAIGVRSYSSVWEAFYNVEIIPAVHMTLDAQVAKSALPNIDTATILGVSLEITF